jgi:hypothetical protein
MTPASLKYSSREALSSLDVRCKPSGAPLAVHDISTQVPMRNRAASPPARMEATAALRLCGAAWMTIAADRSWSQSSPLKHVLASSNAA